jgi:hypothetical protein
MAQNSQLKTFFHRRSALRVHRSALPRTFHCLFRISNIGEVLHFDVAFT